MINNVENRTIHRRSWQEEYALPHDYKKRRESIAEFTIEGDQSYGYEETRWPEGVK